MTGIGVPRGVSANRAGDSRMDSQIRYFVIVGTD